MTDNAREMLVNVAESEECRVAVVENGSLEELYIERASLGGIVGNVYKGRVVNIEAGIQAAFVDLGTSRNGFLHISDLHPRYFPGDTGDLESVGRRQSLKDRPPMQDCLRRGSEVVVQVTKEGLKTKGPTLSTYPALPGKYLVMMPWMQKQGVSHKIEDEDERKRLKAILDEVKPPQDVGFIIRTAGEKAAKRDIQSDLRYLMRMWEDIRKRMDRAKAPVELFQESNLVIRALRDVFNSQIQKIVCDSEPMVKEIRDFLSRAYPRMKGRVTYYDDPIPLFHKYRIEPEIEKIQGRSVPLRCGGSIVIEQTEALVAIDVNSGRHHGPANAEQNALETNLEAATEIARQLRLRDLGGLVICDFIDMRVQKNRKEVERVFRQAMKADRARSKTLAISRFGVVEMTRQRMRTSFQSSIYLTCPHCAGMGFIKSHESLALEVIRLLNLATAHPDVTRIELSVSPAVAEYLQNEKRAALVLIEQRTEKRVVIHAVPDLAGGHHEMVCYNARGTVVRPGHLGPVGGGRRGHGSRGGEADAGNGRSGRSRNGRRRGRGGRSAAEAPETETTEHATEIAPADAPGGEASESKSSRSRSRRRRRKTGSAAVAEATPAAAAPAEASPAEGGDESAESQPSRSRSRRRRKKAGGTAAAEMPAEGTVLDAADVAAEVRSPKAGDESAESKPARSRSRRRRKKVGAEAPAVDTAEGSSAEPAADPEPAVEGATAPAKKAKRTRRRRSKVATAKAEGVETADAAITAGDAPTVEAPAADVAAEAPEAKKKRSRPRRRRSKTTAAKAEATTTEHAADE